MKIFSLLVIIGLMIFPGQTSFAQENNFWPLGYNHFLNFSVEPPTLDSIPIKLSKNPTFQLSSICDSTGKMLLFNDGQYIYDYALRIVDSFDYAHTIVINDPKDRRIVHYLTAGYGITDIVINTASRPYTLRKDTLFLGYVNFFKLKAVQMPHTNGFWLITQAEDSFFVVSFIPGQRCTEKKYVPFTTSAIFRDPNSSMIYSFNVSHDGRSIVSTILTQKPSGNTNLNYLSTVRMCDFDPESGTIFNGRIILADSELNVRSTTRIASSYKYAFYEGEFSPSDSILYVQQIGEKLKNGISISRPILQIDRYSGKKITELEYNRKIQAGSAIPSIQLGPNGKIYFIESNFLALKDSTYKYDSIVNSGGIPNLKRPPWDKWSDMIGCITRPDVRGGGCHLQENLYRLDNLSENIFLPTVNYKYMRVGFRAFQNCEDSVSFINTCDTQYFSRYIWFFGNDTVSGINPRYRFLHSGKYDVKLRASTSAGYSVWSSDTVVFLQKPKADYSTSLKPGCQWVKFNFFDRTVSDTVNILVGQSWQWYFGDGQTLTYKNKKDTVGHVYSHSGNYKVMLVYNNGFCMDTFVQMQDVKILDAPKPGFAFLNEPICVGGILKLKDISQGRVSQVLFTNGEDSSFGTNPQLTRFSHSGKYLISQMLFGPTGCITSDSVYINIHPSFTSTQQPYLHFITFTDNNKIKLNWAPMVGAAQYLVSIKKHEIDKEKKEITTRDTSIEFDSMDTGRFAIYEIVAIDSCGNISGAAKAKPVFLTGYLNQNEDGQLSWTSYRCNSSQRYRYKKESQIDTGWASDGFIDDTFSIEKLDFNRLINHGCLRIRCYENGSDFVAQSNTICLNPKPRIWLPNAFSPNFDGINDSWAPTTFNIADLSLVIYNRWGEEIFSKSGSQISWDGTFRSVPVDDGIYYYWIRYISTENKVFTARGTIQLTK
jgi:gliding motility-associated-like protein